MVKKAAQATPNRMLRVARKERGWTQQQVADRISQARDTIAWKKDHVRVGRQNPTVARIRPADCDIPRVRLEG